MVTETISQAIARKKAEIARLQTQVRALQDVQAESGPGGNRSRRRIGKSRPGQIEDYLKANQGPQPATEIARALGMSTDNVHTALQHYIRRDTRFARGPVRGTYSLKA